MALHSDAKNGDTSPLRAIGFFHLQAGARLFLMPHFAPLLFNQLFPPFYSPVLKPDFDLSLRQTKLLGKIKPLPSDHVLLAREFSFQTLELLHGKDGAHALWFLVGPICFVAPGKERSCKDDRKAINRNLLVGMIIYGLGKGDQVPIIRV